MPPLPGLFVCLFVLKEYLILIITDQIGRKLFETKKKKIQNSQEENDISKVISMLVAQPHRTLSAVPHATQHHLPLLLCSSRSPTPWKLTYHMCCTKFFFPFFSTQKRLNDAISTCPTTNTSFPGSCQLTQDKARLFPLLYGFWNRPF